MCSAAGLGSERSRGAPGRAAQRIASNQAASRWWPLGIQSGWPDRRGRAGASARAQPWQTPRAEPRRLGLRCCSPHPRLGAVRESTRSPRRAPAPNLLFSHGPQSPRAPPKNSGRIASPPRRGSSRPSSRLATGVVPHESLLLGLARRRQGSQRWMSGPTPKPARSRMSANRWGQVPDRGGRRWRTSQAAEWRWRSAPMLGGGRAGPRTDLVVDVVLGLGQAEAEPRSSQLHSVDSVACSNEVLDVAVD